MSRDIDQRPSPNPGLAPDAVPGYRILRVLGQGGMATVYAAQQEHPKRTVALKVLRPSLASPQMLRRFRKEIDLLARLTHPFIAQVYSAGVVHEGGSELPYFVMEFIPSARTILDFADAHDLDRNTRLKLFINVCAAVEHGHRQRVLHLDLKPGNVLINREGHVKVIDFGVARAIEQPSPDVTMETADHAILGSLHAMSPEQIDPAGRDLDARSDVYSLGVLLYRLLFGMLPYDLSATSIVASARTICEKPPRKPRDVDSSVSPALEAVMLRALEKEPALRFRHAGEFGKALRGVLSGAPPRDLATVDDQSHDSSGTSGKVVAIVTGTIIVVALVVSFLMLQRGMASNAQQQREESQRIEAITTAPGGTFTIAPAQQKPYYLTGHAGLITDLSLDETGKLLATSSQDRTVRVWDLEHRSLVHMLTSHQESRVVCVALQSDGSRVASGAENGAIMIEETEDGRIEKSIALPSGPVHFLVFSAGGDLAAASNDLTVRIWNADLRATHTLRSSTGAFITGCFSPAGDSFAAGSTGGDVYIWDLTTGKEIGRSFAGDRAIAAMAFSEDGSMLTVLTENAIAVTIERATGERMHRLAIAGEAPTALALDPAGAIVFVARADRSVEVWDIAQGTSIGEPLHLANPAVRMRYSNASNLLVIGSASGAIEVRGVSLAGAP